MGTIHQLPTDADVQMRLLIQGVSEMIAQHPDHDVARRWAAMAQETMSRYSGPPLPTQAVLDLDTVEGLSASQLNAVHALTEQWMEGYFEDVRRQLMAVHKEMLSLQRTVAELQTDTQY